MRPLILALRALACAMLFALIAMPFAQIIMRGVFNVPMAGAEELTRYFLICLTFLAGALVSLEGGQIRMEEFQAMLPERPRFFLQLLIDAVGIGVFAFFAYAGVSATIRSFNSGVASEILFWPRYLFWAPGAISLLLFTLYATLRLIRLIRSPAR